MSSFIENIKNAESSLTHGFSIIFDSDENTKSKLQDKLAEAHQLTELFISTSYSELLQSEKINIDAEEYFKLGTSAISANLSLYDALMPLLDNIILDEIKSMEYERTISLLTIISILLISAYLFYGFYYSIVEVIHNIVETVNKLAKGDLTVSFKEESKDELNLISKNLNTMVNEFQSLVYKVASASEQVATASLQTSSIAGQTASGINNQNQQIEQVASAAEEMTATVNEVAHNTTNAANETRKVTDETIEGKSILNDTILTINELSGGMSNTRTVIQELETNSEAIGTVLAVIRGIAEQTNLLALNAAIEAARAGEQGRGFAVVADEVRTLAGRTQEATVEINQIIETLQSGAKNAVGVIELNVERTNKTAEQAADAGKALEEISSAISRINEMNLQIAAATEGQSSVTNEICRNIESIHSIADETGRASNESAEASASLNIVASELQAVVSKFKIN